MGLTPGQKLTDIAIDRVFIGSCTNSRIEDLRSAARIAQGKKALVPAIIVPGSTLIKKQAEAEGLDKLFIDAGFEWRSTGCSMCVGMNGDITPPGERGVLQPVIETLRAARTRQQNAFNEPGNGGSSSNNRSRHRRQRFQLGGNKWKHFEN